MKLIKRVLKASVAIVAILIFAVFVLRAIGLMTDHAPVINDQMKPLVDVDDIDNAYRLISFVHEPDFRVDDDQQKVATLLAEWDSSESKIIEATEILKKHQTYLSLLEQAAEKSAFRSTALSSTELPLYNGMVFLSKLSLLKAKLFTEQGEYQRAAKYLAVSLSFNDLISRDANPTLISYIIGQSLQAHTLNEVASLVQSRQLSDEVLSVLGKQLAALSDYSSDGFDLVWSGEHIYSNLMLDDTLDTSFLKRIEWWRADWFTVALILAPEYAIQPGKLNNRGLEKWRKLQSQSDLLCVDRHSGSQASSNATAMTWLQKLAPNGLAEAVYSPETEVDQLDDYFHRRCLSNFQVNATRLLLAIKRYESQSERHIESLSQLVPNYIDRLPIDPFSGQTIEFDSAGRYLYSYGANFNDDDGSLTSLVFNECYRDDECFNNPTVAIDARKQASGQ